MSGEMIPHGTHLPYEHIVQTVGPEAIHIWVVTVPGAAMSMQAVCIHQPAADLKLFTTDAAGNQWLVLDLSFHAFKPDGHPHCCWLGGQACEWRTFSSGLHERVMERALKEPDRDLYIRRALTHELEIRR